MFKNYKREFLKKDIISGIIVALISIPISMGYVQVAGLPVVYMVCMGRFFPVLIFGLLSSSPQFVLEWMQHQPHLLAERLPVLNCSRF